MDLILGMLLCLFMLRFSHHNNIMTSQPPFLHLNLLLVHVPSFTSENPINLPGPGLRPQNVSDSAQLSNSPTLESLEFVESDCCFVIEKAISHSTTIQLQPSEVCRSLGARNPYLQQCGPTSLAMPILISASTALHQLRLLLPHPQI